MRVGGEDWRKKNLGHAKWRVGYFRSILESHQAIPSEHRHADWAEKETLYRGRLKAAMDELERLEGTSQRE
jgi:hypothetical protein